MILSKSKKILIGVQYLLFISLFVLYFCFNLIDSRVFLFGVFLSVSLLTVGFFEIHRESDALFKILISEADAHFRQNEPQAAKKAFSKLLRLKPDSYEATVGLGQSFRMLRDVKNAERMFRKAIELAPSRYEAHFFLGITYLHVSKVGEALESFRNARKANPYQAEIYYFMGKLYEKLQDHEDAIEHFQLHLELNPESKNRLELQERIKRLQAKLSVEK